MRKNMKRMFVFVLALMPCLSINVFAQENGGSLPDDDLQNQSVELRGDNPRPRGGGSQDDGSLNGSGQDDGYLTDPGLIDFHLGGNMPRSGFHTPHGYHSDGVVFIKAAPAITSMQVTVTRLNDNQSWSNVSKTNTLSVIVSTTPGIYHIDLTLSDGSYYLGEYILE